MWFGDTQLGIGYCSSWGPDTLGSGFSAFLNMGRCKKLGSKKKKKFSWKYLTIWGLVLTLVLEHKVLYPDFHPEFLPGWIVDQRLQWLTTCFFFQKHIFLFMYVARLGPSCSMWDLVAQPGIKPGAPALGVQSRRHWTTKEVLAWFL